MDLEVQDGVTSTNLDKLTKIYIKIRDAKEKLTSEYKAKYAELGEQMGVLETEMLDVCKEMNAKSVNTKHGTIICSVKSRYWTNDWDSLYQVIKEHDAFAVLTRSIHQSNMKEFLVENPDILPMGLNVESEYTVVVRRSKEN
jgi:hypothetical protein